uniref:Uncharacterized protein n=1 Tax=Panagrolaimus sp. ES5 TaxID=591445 RepID=A0AC34G4X9_9BILA
MKKTVCRFERIKGLNRTKVSWQTMQDDFMEQGIRHFYSDADGLNITYEQMTMLLDYPNTLEALLPILKLTPNIRDHKELFKDAAQNAIVLQKLIFEDFVNLDQIENHQPAYFGGFYRNENNNPFTGRAECPPYFEAIDILENFKICISYDSERKWPIRLGKIFFHCGAKEDIEEICRRGYSEYLAGTIKNCDYKYCIQFQSRNVDEIAPPTINKPPFV